MMKFKVEFDNEQYAGEVLRHFEKQGFSHSLVERVRVGRVFISKYALERVRASKK